MGKQLTLGEIARLLGCELSGDKELIITGLAPIETAKQGELTFIANPKYMQFAESSNASAFIVDSETANKLTGKNLIVSKDSYFSFARLLTVYHEKERSIPGIDKNVFISSKAVISPSASIYPNVYIGEGAVIKDTVIIYPGCFIGKNVTIGNDSIIYPNVVIREDTVIGNNVIIHAGTVIGSDGFGYAFNAGRHFKIPQVGKVVIEDNVEIGANVTIDRAAMGSTVIGAGTKIDNLVQIAHNVKIGKNNIIVAQTGISGSSELGDYVTIGGQAGISGHLKIGGKVRVAAKSGITNDVPAGQTVAGFPAVPIEKWRKSAVLSNNLPEMRKKLLELEKRLAELEKQK